eukprot:m.15783 g.15783  ORF g.15783 m.15783 type:complete len:266 (-) comp4524_c0_seq1:136-933(-)
MVLFRLLQRMASSIPRISQHIQPLKQPLLFAQPPITQRATVVQWYLKHLKTHPHRTNMVTSFILMLVGDGIAQHLETNTEDLGSKKVQFAAPGTFLPQGIQLDPTRSLVLSTWAGSMGVLFTSWFKYMDRVFISWPRFTGVIGKVTLTSVGLSPFTNVAFLSIVTIMEHIMIKHEFNSKKLMWAAEDKLEKEFIHTLLSSWTFWGPVNFISWMYLPPYIRVAFGGFSATIWNVYLSIIQHRKYLKRRHFENNDDINDNSNDNDVK